MVVQSVYDHDPRVRRKAEALVEAGYSVDVLSLRPPNGEESYILNDVSIRTLALGKQRGSRLRYLFEYFAFFVWAAYRTALQMSSRQYQVIDTNSLPDFLVFAPFLARWMGAKLILDLHEITPEFYMSKYGLREGSITVRILAWFEKISVDFADQVITINKPIEDLLVCRGLDRSKSTIIMNSVDEARFVADSPAQTDSKQRDDPRFVLMYHGTLTNLYGLDLAIEAIALAQGEAPTAELWILGDGPEKENLEKLAETLGIASKVRLVGRVPAKDIPSWLAQCDLGILPIRKDVFLDFAFPNKLPEFIIAGIPVLISRLRSIQHYFTDQALAFFEPNDSKDLARAVVQAYLERSEKDRKVAKAREEYVPIRWDVMKQRYLNLVAELAPLPEKP